MLNIQSPLSGIRSPFGRRRGGGDPFAALLSTLLSGASQLIAHPLEYGSLLQDRAGTVPVTESGQLVGHCLDAGPGGYHATAVSDAARGIFRDVGGKRWIEYNGVNTAYHTPVLPAPGVDKAQVFAGVRRLRAGTTEMMLEMSPNVALNNGSFYLAWLLLNRLNVYGRGTTNGDVYLNDAVAPQSLIVSGLFDTAQAAPNKITGRKNGSASGFVAAGDMGTGNFNPSGTYPLYYGARAGTSLFFNGYHYATLGPIVRLGANATPEQIAAAEAYYTEGLPS